MDASLPFVILGDSTRLKQVLINLVSNAIKFTENGEILLRVDDQTHGDVRRLLVAVVDTGIGIPLAVQDKLFKPFVQADSSITRRFGGSGLGLAISHRLVELMGGELKVESELGRGATFSFSLPLTAGEPEASAEGTPSGLPSPIVARSSWMTIPSTGYCLAVSFASGECKLWKRSPQTRHWNSFGPTIVSI